MRNGRRIEGLGIFLSLVSNSCLDDERMRMESRMKTRALKNQ